MKKESRVTIRFGLKNQTEAVVPLPRTSEAKEFVKINDELSVGCVWCEVQVRQKRGSIYTEESGSYSYELNAKPTF